MSVTIATHNGTTLSREHNVRNRNVTDKEKHIDRNGVYEIWHDEKIRHAYKRIFGAAVEEYNAKQKRADRKIKNYFREVSKDAHRNAAYEMIVGVYGGDVGADLKREILHEFFSTWKERNPNLELIGAYFHFDEEGKDPHLHLDYIPVGHGYTNGMHTQNGLNRALWEQDGFQSHSRHNSAQIKWERRENAFLESLCEARGLKVDHPMIEGAKHLETKVYKAEKQLEEAEREAAEIEKQMGPTRAEYEALKEYINAMQINYNLIDGVKENKTITGKIRSYDVPKDVWETQKITKAERDAQERARARWEKLVKDYPEISREYEKLLQGNAEKAETIARVNETLRNMSESARSEFFGLFNATRREKVAEHEKAPGTQKNEPREPEER